MATWLMPAVAEAPCQCFTPGLMRTTSPGRISWMGRPHCCTRPAPAVTIRVCPSGWVCQAVRAPGSKVTSAPDMRDGGSSLSIGSTRTAPVNHSDDPLTEGWEPLR